MYGIKEVPPHIINYGGAIPSPQVVSNTDCTLEIDSHVCTCIIGRSIPAVCVIALITAQIRRCR